MRKSLLAVLPKSEQERYWYSDGLPDIGLGLGFWLMTAVFMNIELVPTLLGRVLALPLTGFAISLFFPWAIRTARARWLSHPPIRTASRPSLRYQLFGMLLLVPLVTVLGLLVARLGESGNLARDAADLFALSVGLFVSFVPFMLAFISGAVRYYLVALPLVLVTLGLVFSPAFVPQPGWSVVFVWLVTGLCFLLCGLLTLASFRQRA